MIGAHGLGALRLSGILNLLGQIQCLLPDLIILSLSVSASIQLDIDPVRPALGHDPIDHIFKGGNCLAFLADNQPGIFFILNSYIDPVLIKTDLQLRIAENRGQQSAHYSPDQAFQFIGITCRLDLNSRISASQAKDPT